MDVSLHPLCVCVMCSNADVWCFCSNISADDMLYTETDLEESMEKIETINFHEVKEVSGIKFWCYHAGHVLGAAMFMIEIAGVKVRVKQQVLLCLFISFCCCCLLVYCQSAYVLLSQSFFHPQKLMLAIVIDSPVGIDEFLGIQLNIWTCLKTVLMSYFLFIFISLFPHKIQEYPVHSKKNFENCPNTVGLWKVEVITSVCVCVCV